MRNRAKISFAAFKKRMTVKELIIRQINETYLFMRGDPNNKVEIAQFEINNLIDQKFAGSLDFIIKSHG